jgi:hypothetical protein
LAISDYSRSITGTYKALGAGEVLTAHAGDITQTEKTYEGTRGCAAPRRCGGCP